MCVCAARSARPVPDIVLYSTVLQRRRDGIFSLTEHPECPRCHNIQKALSPRAHEHSLMLVCAISAMNSAWCCSSLPLRRANVFRRSAFATGTHGTHYRDKTSALINTKSSAADLWRASSEVPFKPRAFERGRSNGKRAAEKSNSLTGFHSGRHMT